MYGDELQLDGRPRQVIEPALFLLLDRNDYKHIREEVGDQSNEGKRYNDVDKRLSNDSLLPQDTGLVVLFADRLPLLLLLHLQLLLLLLLRLRQWRA